MKNVLRHATIGTCLLASVTVAGANEMRALVTMPEKMQEHMLTNMRDHLTAVNEILAHLNARRWQQAADVAEDRLGMSSLKAHGAAHMAGYMPKPMQDIGTSMHRAASRFALTAQEGELAPALQGLQEVTTACVACHASYRIR